MDLPNPKELKAILKVCREAGVETIEVGTLKVKLGELPREVSFDAPEVPDGPSTEDLLLWSVAPDPLLDRLAQEAARQ